VIDRALKLNDLQVIGTHNSYKRAIDPTDLALIRASSKKRANGLDYSHPPLTEQLDAGARVLELDVYADPQGGLYADPLARRINPKSAPYDAAPMRRPGLKVLHVQDWDYRSNCALFTDCLAVRRIARAGERDPPTGRHNDAHGHLVLRQRPRLVRCDHAR